MNTRLKTIRYSIFAAALLAAGAVQAETVYKWVDDDGVTHYGDSIPAEYSESRHSVLNEQGVELSVFEGALTPEEREQKRITTEAAVAAKRKQEKSQLRDRVLLSTYLSTQEIEALRDRRIELVQAQIHVTEIYLDNLRSKLGKLEKESQRYSPYNTDPKAKPIDEKLARELADTIDSIMLYERTLKGSETEQQRLQQKFSEDIDRFVELKTQIAEH
jgi:hypothetical protein